MQYARIAVYQVKPGGTVTLDEAIRRSQAGMLPIFRNQPGFIGYGMVKAAEHTAISISFWQSRQQAEAAVQLVTSWSKDNFPDLTQSVQNYVGELSFFSSTSHIGS